MPTTYTLNMRIPKPDFLTSPWHAVLNSSLDTIDRYLYNVLVNSSTLNWETSFDYVQGNRVIDPTDGTLWVCVVEHTSRPAGTMSDDRSEHPSYWSNLSLGLQVKGAWTNDTVYLVNDITYDSALGISAICIVAHTSSSAPNDIEDDAANWAFIMDSSVISNTASMITFDDAPSGLDAINVQDAIDEVVTETNAALALRAPINNPTFTSNPAAPTASVGTNTTQIATTAFVQAAAALLAPITSPGFGGTPTAPTATAGTNTTQIATTAFVMANGGFAAGTTIVFVQTDAPTGWTKGTGLVDYALRFTNGTITSGGAIGVASMPNGSGGSAPGGSCSVSVSVSGSASISGSGTIDTTSTYDAAGLGGGSTLAVNGGGVTISGSGSSSGSGSGGGSIAVDNHTHALDARIKYYDVIYCSKN